MVCLHYYCAAGSQLLLQTCVGFICTTSFVPTCSDQRVDCSGFQPSSLDSEFRDLYPNAYAKVCEEPSTKKNCLYTDVTYKTCGEAKGTEFGLLLRKIIFCIPVQDEDDSLCLPLADGRQDCKNGELAR